jgi:hypothetical protein
MPNQHSQEPTSFSMTDTVVDNRGSEDRPTLASTFSGQTLTTTPSDPFMIHDLRQVPVRKNSLDPRLMPTIIPPEHNNRTLVLCFDGTGDQFDADNSNIVQLVSLLKKNDRSKQMVYYQVSKSHSLRSEASTCSNTLRFPRLALAHTLHQRLRRP